MNDDFYTDLCDAAWNVLHENPDAGMEQWIEKLLAQYPAEIVDALGTNPDVVYSALLELFKRLATHNAK